jgi:hypothetical protein
MKSKRDAYLLIHATTSGVWEFHKMFLKWCCIIGIVSLFLSQISTTYALITGHQAPPPWLVPWIPPQVPDNYRSPGVHKVFVQSQDLNQIQLLEQIETLYRFDYQTERVYLISDKVLRQLPAEQSQQLSINDRQNLLMFRDQFIDTTAEPNTPIRQSLPLDEVRPMSNGTRQLYLIQYTAPIQDAWRDALINIQGLDIVSYWPVNAYVVWADQSAQAAIANQYTTNPYVQWQQSFPVISKIHPAFNLNYTGDVTAVIQLVFSTLFDPSINIIKAKATAVLKGPRRVANYTNITVEIPASELEAVAQLANVFNIEPVVERTLFGERQDQILAGNLNAAQTGPIGPGYLNWLISKGFTPNFDFAVDVTDDGFDRGETSAANCHPVFHDNGGASRVAYVRMVSGTTVDTANDHNQGGHGTLNASIVAGYNDATLSDTDFYYHADTDGYRYGLGMAPYVKVGATKIFNPYFTYPDHTMVLDMAYMEGARISSNSWGASWGSGSYDATSQEFDSLVRDACPATAPSGGQVGNQEMVVVFAAGNNGPNPSTLGDCGSTAKNTITVGASENFNATGDCDGCSICDVDADNINQVIFFSSRGPTADQRVKPDIMAPGTHVFSAASQHSSFNGSSVCGGPNNDFVSPPDDAYYPPDPDTSDTQDQDQYTWSSGTSHSTPAVAGGAALLRQWFLDNRHTAPSPAMTKAYLMNSAAYMTGPVDDLPSNNQGMGQMNLGMAFDDTPRLIFDQIKTAYRTATSDASEIFTVTGLVADKTRPFRVTMAYTDAPGTPGAGLSQHNDLDLEVQVGGNFYRGNKFTLDASKPVNFTEAPDTLNNVESVFLPAGESGSFTVRVRPTNIVSDGIEPLGTNTRQDFALVIYNAEFPPRDPVDIILVLDVSGSMASKAPGGTMPKIDLLKRAVEMFISMWEPFSIPEDRMGVVYFSDAIAGTYPSSPPLLVPFQANINNIIADVNSQTTHNCTALGGGILTAVRGFDSLPNRQRHVIVFTNGMQNRSPMVEEVSTTAHQILTVSNAGCGSNSGESGIPGEPGINLADYDVNFGIKAIHSIGTGTPAGTYQKLLSSIASETGGRYHFTEDPDEDLEDFFLEDLVEALRLDPVQKVATLTGTLAKNDVGHTRTFEINASVRQLAVGVSWRGDLRPDAVDYLLKTPDGKSVPVNFIEVRNGPFYRIANMTLPLPGHQHAGTWQLVFQPKLEQDVDYRIHVIADDPGIRYYINLPTSGLSVGQTIPISVWVQEGTNKLTDLQDVRATFTRPTVGYGTLMANNKVSTDVLMKPAVNELYGDGYATLAQKQADVIWQNDAIRKSYTKITETIQLRDSGQASDGDAVAGDGIYSALYRNTSRPGSIRVDVSIQHKATDGSLVHRTESRSLDLQISQFDLRQSVLDVQIVDDPLLGTVYDTTVALVDQFGNLLGPADHLTSTLVVNPVDKWIAEPVPFTDNLDGTYSVSFPASRDMEPLGASIQIGGTFIPLPLPSF